MALFVGKGGIEHCAVELELQSLKEFAVKKALDLLDTRPAENIEKSFGPVRVIIRLDELALLKKRCEQSASQQGMCARQAPAASCY